jgi:hypothetical protein
MTPRRASCLILSLLLCLSSSVQAATVGPLAPGKPSGVKTAQAEYRGTVLLVGGALLAVAGFAFLIAASQHGKGTPLTISGGSPQVGSSGSGSTTTTATTTTTQ